jgi:uncharacterized phiE125 gp8 family phage protein
MKGDRITKIASAAAPQYPVTLEEIKAHLKIETDLEDALITSYLIAAVDWASEALNRAVAQESYLVVRDTFPVSAWRLPLGKVVSITSIEYVDSNGVTQNWNPSPIEYQLDNDSDYQARLRPKSGFTWPDTGEYLSAARVTLVAGWTPTQLPFTVKQAVLLKIASMFETRGPGDEDSEPIDNAAQMLLSGWKLPEF